MTDLKYKTVLAAVLAFQWDDYSFHDVEMALDAGELEWAEDLARHLIARLGGAA